MKKLWTKVLFLILIIWAATAVITSIIDSKETTQPVMAVEEKPRAFKLLLENIDNLPNPKLKSASAILIDLDEGEVLMSKNITEVRPIASLTKLVTAIVFLNTLPNMSQMMTVTREDKEGAGRSRLYSGESVSLYDLFNLMLICSDNAAARVVARSTGMDDEEFAARMNEYALGLDLEYTHFSDPTGLDPCNVSTAAECSIILKTALDNVLIKEVMSRRNYSFKPVNGKRTYTVHNTNRMLFGREDIIGGKTGYIYESGYCLALGFEINDGRKLGAVVLGAPTSGTRFRDAARMLAGMNSAQHAVN